VRKWALAKLAVSAAALGYVLLTFPLAGVLGALRSASPAWVLVALGLKAAAVLASAAVWHAMLAPGVGGRASRSARVYFASLHAGLAGPGNLAGDAYRVAAMGRGRADRGVASLLGERALSFVALAGCAALGAWMTPLAAGWRAPLTALSALALAGLLAAVAAGRPLAARVPGAGLAARVVRASLEGLARLREPPRAALAIAGALALPLLTAASTWALFAAVGQPLAAGFALFAGCASALVVLLPVSVQGIGVREGAFLLLFTGLAGVPGGLSVAASLLSLSAGVALGLAAAVPMWVPGRSRAPGPAALGLLPLAALAAASGPGGVGDAIAKLVALLRQLLAGFADEMSYLPPGAAPLVMIFGGLFVVALALVLSLMRPALAAMGEPDALPAGAAWPRPPAAPVAPAAAAPPAPAPPPMPPLPANLFPPPPGVARGFEDGAALGRALPTPDLDSVLDAAERLGLGQAHVVTVEPHRQVVRLAGCQTCRLRPAPGAGPPGCAFERGFLQAAMQSVAARAVVTEAFCARAADGACEFEIRAGG
jgi:hypothetical protein